MHNNANKNLNEVYIYWYGLMFAHIRQTTSTQLKRITEERGCGRWDMLHVYSLVRQRRLCWAVILAQWRPLQTVPSSICHSIMYISTVCTSLMHLFNLTPSLNHVVQLGHRLLFVLFIVQCNVQSSTSLGRALSPNFLFYLFFSNARRLHCKYKCLINSVHMDNQS